MTVRLTETSVTLESVPLKLAKSANIASAATVNLAAATGNLVHVTGSAGPITSFGTVPAGAMFTLVFDATPTIAYNATTTRINSGVGNYVCRAGDRAVLLSEGNGSWLVNIIRVDGTSVASGSTPKTISSSRSLNAADDGKVLTVTAASGITLTVPSGLPDGFGCSIFQASSGAATLSASGVTITPSTVGHNKTGGQGKISALVQVAANSYSFCGGTA